MINNEDYQCISTLDSEKRTQYLQQNADQSAKTFLNLLSHVSKDQTIQYILVMIDDMLQEDRHRIQIFHDYASKRKENIWGPFLNLLNRQNGFIVNMSSRILAKLACWSGEQMPKSDLHFYLQWLKDQLTLNVSKVAGEYEIYLSLFENSINRSTQEESLIFIFHIWSPLLYINLYISLSHLIHLIIFLMNFSLIIYVLSI